MSLEVPRRWQIWRMQGQQHFSTLIGRWQYDDYPWPRHVGRENPNPKTEWKVGVDPAIVSEITRAVSRSNRTKRKLCEARPEKGISLAVWTKYKLKQSWKISKAWMEMDQVYSCSHHFGGWRIISLLTSSSLFCCFFVCLDMKEGQRIQQFASGDP